MTEESDALHVSPLDGLHRALGARIVGFAGYAMPVSYPAGILAEHRACREEAALFDVSHMGQAGLRGMAAAAALERLVPGDIAVLAPGRQRYTLLTNAAGGILDDLMVARLAEDDLFLIVNAARKAADFAHITAHLPPDVTLTPHPERALLAFQGPKAMTLLAPLAPALADLHFMAVRECAIAGIPCLVSRSGYTGEDGVEISLPAARPWGRWASRCPACCRPGSARAICSGSKRGSAFTARISTRPRRRSQQTWPGRSPSAGARLGIFPAAPRSRPSGKPARRASALASASKAGRRCEPGLRSSPTGARSAASPPAVSVRLSAPIAMGYVAAAFATPGTALAVLVRERALAASVVPLPFLPHRYAS